MLKVLVLGSFQVLMLLNVFYVPNRFVVFFIHMLDLYFLRFID